MSAMALFANSLRCNGASAAEGRPSVARLASSRQPVSLSGHLGALRNETRADTAVPQFMQLRHKRESLTARANTT